MPDDFTISRKEIRAILTSPEVRAELVRRGNKVKARAQALAPRDTGALAASHDVVVDTPKDRLRVRVAARVPYAAIVGARTGYLGRALAEGGRS